MKIGYARVSTQDQNLELQIDALQKAECEKIFNEKASGASKERPELARLLDQLRKGDTVVIWRLDRLGRSLKHLIDLVTEFEKLEVRLISISDAIDTSTPSGRLVFNIFGSLAQFERELIKERTNAGLAAARARGRLGGRKKGLTKQAEHKAIVAEKLYKDNTPINDITKTLNIAKSTLYRYLRHQGVESLPSTKK